MLGRLLQLVGAITLLVLIADLLDRLVELEQAMDEMQQEFSHKPISDHSI